MKPFGPHRLGDADARCKRNGGDLHLGNNAFLISRQHRQQGSVGAERNVVRPEDVSV
jgi:hypothetical protein